jgi:MATE family multidrug resistance protein
MAITQLCTEILEFEDLMFVGHLGSTNLATTHLGSAYFTCTSWLASRLANALDTLIPQASCAKQFRMFGIFGNRVIVVTSLACMPIAILYWFSENIFTIAQQDPAIARLSGQYVRYLLLSLVPLVLYRTMASYLVNQNMQRYPMIITILTVVINLMLEYLIVIGVGYKGLGFIRAPITTSITRLIQLLLLLAVIIGNKLYKKTWTGLCLRESLHWRGTIDFLKIDITRMLMDLLDIRVFEGTAVPSGILGDSHLEFLVIVILQHTR